MTLGLSPANSNVTKYSGDQLADTPCVSAPRAPTTSDINYPLFCLWRNANKQAVSPDAEGDMWYLARFQPNGSLGPLAIWVKLSSGTSGDIEKFTPSSGTSPVLPDAAGNVNMLSTVNGGLITIGGTNTINFQMQSPFALSDFIFQTSAGSRVITIISFDNTANTANAQLSLVTQSAGGSPATVFQAGANQFIWGYDNINGRFALARSTVLGTNDVIEVSGTGGGGVKIIENVGINTNPVPGSAFPLVMKSSTNGFYLTSVGNSSSGTSASAGYQAINDVTNSFVLSMASSTYSTAYLANNSYLQTGGDFVVDLVGMNKAFRVFYNALETISVTNIGSTNPPTINIDQGGYLNLGGAPGYTGQAKVNTFQSAALSVTNGGSTALVTVGAGQIWMFSCCTTNASNDSTYRATAIVYGYSNADVFIQHLDTSKITFTNAGNALSVANAGAATVTLNVFGIRMY